MKDHFFNTLNLPTGISDCHNLISTIIKGQLPIQQRSKITYSSYKTFDIEKFKSDIAKIEIDYNNKGDINADKVHQIYPTYERDFINNLTSMHL